MPGTWHGGSSAPTNAAYFGTPRGAKLSDFHEADWAAGCALVEQLLDERDGNDQPVIQLIYTRDDDAKVIAYRFTSDWAYRKFNGPLVNVTSSLGRGVFEPFRDESTFQNFCAD